MYVLRTSEFQQRLSVEDTVRSYKSLSQVEHAFRCLKGADLLVRPIHHGHEDRAKAHIFLCLLAYYVEWHLRRAWSSNNSGAPVAGRTKTTRSNSPCHRIGSGARKKANPENSRGISSA
jgi:transposase